MGPRDLGRELEQRKRINRGVKNAAVTKRRCQECVIRTVSWYVVEEGLDGVGSKQASSYETDVESRGT